jgi:hypothetical protein
MNLTLSKRALAGLPLVIALAGCAPSTILASRSSSKPRHPTSQCELPAAVLKNG